MELSWPNLGHNPGISLEGLRKIMQIASYLVSGPKF